MHILFYFDRKVFSLFNWRQRYQLLNFCALLSYFPKQQARTGTCWAGPCCKSFTEIESQFWDRHGSKAAELDAEKVRAAHERSWHEHTLNGKIQSPSIDWDGAAPSGIEHVYGVTFVYWDTTSIGELSPMLSEDWLCPMTFLVRVSICSRIWATKRV